MNRTEIIYQQNYLHKKAVNNDINDINILNLSYVHGAMAGPKAETQNLFRFIKSLELEEYREQSRDRPIYSCIEKILCIYKSAGLLMLASNWQNYRPLFYVPPPFPSGRIVRATGQKHATTS
jgi:hypothetical protein